MLNLKCLNFPRLAASVPVVAASLLALFAAQNISFAQERHPENSATPLQPGDVLLVPLNCYVCNAIEKETGVPYSHSVVVANAADNLADVDVYEAWGTTRKTTLSEIIQRAEKKQKLFHMRPLEFSEGGAPSESDLRAVFKRQFAPTKFDDEFLWDNVDDQGIEKIYCAEFVVKFINTFLNIPLQPEPMSFVRLKDFWERYYKQFNLEVPEGKPGASPALLYFSERLIKLGTLETNRSEPRELP
ncbi:MAG: hypothetical protein FJY29_03295 [Betaproteobacteria bacterium]|nr:hypothetical protein [Betaproteobacteria bacterium]